mgnify:CR=1 FL=1
MARKIGKRGKRSAPEGDPLSRRERQIMDIIYATGEASARDVWEQMPDAPSYATVRTLLRVLLEKGHLRHRREGRSYIYSPSRSREAVARTAMRRLLETFYGGSVEQAVCGLLELRDTEIDRAELERIEQLIEARKTRTKKQTR